MTCILSATFFVLLGILSVPTNSQARLSFNFNPAVPITWKQSKQDMIHLKNIRWNKSLHCDLEKVCVTWTNKILNGGNKRCCYICTRFVMSSLIINSWNEEVSATKSNSNSSSRHHHIIIQFSRTLTNSTCLHMIYVHFHENAKKYVSVCGRKYMALIHQTRPLVPIIIIIIS